MTGSRTAPKKARKVRSVPGSVHKTESHFAKLAFCELAMHRANSSEDSKKGKVRVAPDWIHVTPVDGQTDDGHHLVRGRDGRQFVVIDPNRVIESTELPLQFDRDHGAVVGGLFGPPPSTRAAARGDELIWVAPGDETDEFASAGFYTHIEYWTEEGREDVEGGYYWGISPAIHLSEREPIIEGGEPPPPELVRFVNIALTNMPNLRMEQMHSAITTRIEELAPQLNQETEEETEDMDPKLAAMGAKLGLTGDFTAADVANAATAKFATDAEALAAANDELRSMKTAAHTAKIEAALDRHSKKFAPAERDSLREYIEHVPGGLEKFEAKFSKLPDLLVDAPAPEETETNASVLDDVEKKLIERHGWTLEQWKEAKA